MIFRKMHAFGCHGKHYFLENDFRLTTNFPFDHGNSFQFLFSLQMISGTGDAQGRTRELTDASSIAPSNAKHRSDQRRDRWRDLAKHRSRLVRTVLHEIAPSDRDRRRDLAFFLSLVLPLRVPSSGNHLK